MALLGLCISTFLINNLFPLFAEDAKGFKRVLIKDEAQSGFRLCWHSNPCVLMVEEIKEQSTNPHQQPYKRTNCPNVTERVALRSSYGSYTLDEVAAMIKRYNFYDSWKNPKGNFAHDYEKKVIHGDIVVIDHATGLMWHQWGSMKDIPWKNVESWIRNLNKRRYAGYNDWRLPSVEEAASLLEPNYNNSYLYINPVFSKRQWYIWTGDKCVSTSTWQVSGSDAMWHIDFGFGEVHVLRSEKVRRSYYVRPTRSVK